MAIEREDWIYLGGAAAGGIVLGAVMKSLLSGSPDPFYTGMARTWSPKNHGPDVTGMIWALPRSGGEEYFLTFKSDDGRKETFPDMKVEIFTSPFTAAMWADGLMEDLEYTIESDWESDWEQLFNEASRVRRLERKPSVASRRKP